MSEDKDVSTYKRPPFAVAKPREEAQYLKVFVYGKPGAGKTFFAGTAEDDPRTSPVLFGSVEGGLLTISGRGGTEEGQGIDVAQITDFGDDIGKIYKYLSDGDHPYKTFVLDSLSDLQRLSMLDIMDGVVKQKKDRDPDIPSIQEWGKNIEQIRKVIRYFRDLPMHLVFTCLEQDSKDDLTGAIMTKPMLSGKLADEAPAFFDIVGRLYAVEDKSDPKNPKILRQMQVQQTAKVIAKDRSSKLGVHLQEPSIPRIMELIHGPADS